MESDVNRGLATFPLPRWTRRLRGGYYLLLPRQSGERERDHNGSGDELQDLGRRHARAQALYPPRAALSRRNASGADRPARVPPAQRCTSRPNGDAAWYNRGRDDERLAPLA